MNLPLQSRFFDKTPSASHSSRYQSDIAVAQYCDAHYGPSKFGVANFPEKMAQICVEAQKNNPQHSALDLGCSVGRTTFELATCFDQVTGIDFSARFIDIAHHIKKHGKICYRLHDDGDQSSEHMASLTDFDLAATTSRVTFHQGDVQNLETSFHGYDLILAANLIDRINNPGDFLANIHLRLSIGGLLVIASPYDWIERFTPKKQWLSNRFNAGSSRSSLKGLRGKLVNHFTAEGDPQEVEFVIRDTARTFHHSISQVTTWRRVS